MMQLSLVEYQNLNRRNEFGSRVYETPEGNKYPSVTTIFGQLSKEAIDKWKRDVGEEESSRINKESLNVGNSMHKLCENYILDIDAKPETNKKAISLFEQIKPEIDKLDIIYGMEIPLYSDYLKMAGTADLIASEGDVLRVYDFKNSRKPKREEWISAYQYQAVAYARMFWERYGVLPTEITIWVAVWDGSLQKFTFKVKDIYPKMIAILKVWHPLWKHAVG